VITISLLISFIPCRSLLLIGLSICQQSTYPCMWIVSSFVSTNFSSVLLGKSFVIASAGLSRPCCFCRRTKLSFSCDTMLLLKMRGFSGFNISLSFVIYPFSFCFFFSRSANYLFARNRVLFVCITRIIKSPFVILIKRHRLWRDIIIKSSSI
jgi:hypothetical protein